ncbi:MAG: PH domain-containing protein [Longimicrobiaceae bacterium]
MRSDPETGRRLHPLTLIFEAIRFGRSFVIPAVVAGVGTGGDDLIRMLAFTALFIAVPAPFYAVLRYLTFRYRLAGNELVIDSGMLERKRRVIPLHRVQNIDTRRSFLQRLLKVAEVRVETASSEGAEASLVVLGVGEAESLRAEMLRRRRAAGKGESAGEEAAPLAPDSRRVAALSVGELAIAGATANRAGLIAVGIASAIELLTELRIDLPVPDLDPESVLASTPVFGVLLVALALILAVVIVGWVISIVTTVIGFHGFVLDRRGDELRKRYGLLSRTEAHVPLERVQAVRVEESLLRRPFGLAALKIETAGSRVGQGQRGGAEAFIPIARRADVPRLVAELFDDFDYAAVRYRPSHPKAARRALGRYSVPVAVLWLLLFWLGGWRSSLWALPLLAVSYLCSRVYLRHLGHALEPGFVVARNGFWNRITWVIPERKVQTVHQTESPFQRRHGLATVTVDTAAASGLRQPGAVDLGRTDANEFLAALSERVVRPAGEERPRLHDTSRFRSLG